MEKKSDHPADDKREPTGLFVYRPEDQVFQRLCLCDYLNELPEISDESEEEMDVFVNLRGMKR